MIVRFNAFFIHKKDMLLNKFENYRSQILQTKIKTFNLEGFYHTVTGSQRECI